MNLDAFLVFRDNKKSLQYTSRDTDKEPIQYMTFNTKKVIDFDSVKTEVTSESFRVKDNVARSVDALFSVDDGLLMVEFKNGDFSGIEIAQKVNNSILLFNHITKVQIDFTRENMSFVLVYNKESKRLNYMDAIALHKARLAHEGLKLFGTDKLKGFSLKKVYMLEKSEFDKFLDIIWTA